jgi:hypothetical protein
MPEIASIREDFPALCQPMAAIVGMSRSASTLWDIITIKLQRTKTPEGYAPKSMHTVEKLEHCLLSGCILWVRQTNRRETGEKRDLFLFLPLEREDGRSGGLRSHADRMQVLLLGCASPATRHLYIRIRPWRHRKFSGRKRVPVASLFHHAQRLQ